MDDLIELLIELVLDGSHELLKSRKVPKWIRYLIALIFISIIIGLIVLEIILLEETFAGGIIIISIGLFLLVGVTVKIEKYFNN